MKLSFYYQLSSEIILSVRRDLVCYHSPVTLLSPISIKSLAIL